MKPQGKDFEAILNAQLAVEIKKQGKNSRFVRITPAVYGLSEIGWVEAQEMLLKRTTDQDWSLVHAELEDSNRNKNHEPNPIRSLDRLLEPVDTGFTGKAGEFYVTSELLLRGFNANLLPVDTGMDILATKNNKLYSLQVKTANRQRRQEEYLFSLSQASLERDYAGAAYYILVMLHPDTSKSVAVFSHGDVKRLIHEGAIRERGSQYSLLLMPREEILFLGNQQHPVTYHWNHWELIV